MQNKRQCHQIIVDMWIEKGGGLDPEYEDYTMYYGASGTIRNLKGKTGAAVAKSKRKMSSKARKAAQKKNFKKGVHKRRLQRNG